jgi:hypothetical protein
MLEGTVNGKRVMISGEVVFGEHRAVVFAPKAKSWMVSCTCGYRSTYRTLESGAADEAITHIYRARQRQRLHDAAT